MGTQNGISKSIKTTTSLHGIRPYSELNVITCQYCLATHFPQVGQSTGRYLDDTDWRGGGCEYSWMIRTPGNAPMWLKNLQLCFKWRATGDRQQCGHNGLPSTICTKNNQWSRSYNDDSSVRPGGCMMSWGLKN